MFKTIVILCTLALAGFDIGLISMEYIHAKPVLIAVLTVSVALLTVIVWKLVPMEEHDGT